jgi:hypothetical protein
MIVGYLFSPLLRTGRILLMVADYTRVVSSNDYKFPSLIAVSVGPSVEGITVRENLLS